MICGVRAPNILQTSSVLREWSLAGSLMVAAFLRQRSLVHHRNATSPIVGRIAIICGLRAAGFVGPSLGHAANVVGRIVGGCGILAAIIV
jgi:hypothetical protein